MKKAEIDALLTAHGGRAHAVASLHVLRAPSLGPEEHGFLVEHARALATIDLQRWLAHAAPAQRPAVIDALEQFAAKEPARFEYEIARVSQFGLRDGERGDLADRLRGRVAASVVGSLMGERPPSVAPARRASSAPPAPRLAAPGLPSADFFDPGDILRELDVGADGGAEIGFGPPGAMGGFGPPGAMGGAGSTGLDELLISAEFFADAGGLGGPACPALDALLSALAGVNGAKARTAWKARALATARDTAEDWSPAVTRLPPEMRDAALLRAGASPRLEERAALLEWLLQNGARRQQLVDLTLALLSMVSRADGVRQWLAQQWIPKLLSDKAAWSKHGPSVLAAIIEARAFTEMDELFTVASSGAGLPGAPPVAARAADLGGPVFTAFFRALVGLSGRALTAGRREEALAFASALASIGVPSKGVADVSALRRKRAAKGEVSTLLGLAESRARRPGQVPRVEDFVAAVHLLSDALS